MGREMYIGMAAWPAKYDALIDYEVFPYPSLHDDDACESASVARGARSKFAFFQYLECTVSVGYTGISAICSSTGPIHSAGLPMAFRRSQALRRRHGRSREDDRPMAASSILVACSSTEGMA